MPAYYLHHDNQVQGPYSEAEVKVRFDAGILQPDTQVCADGGEWGRLADTLPSLFPPPAGPVSASPSVAFTTSTFNPYKPPEVAIAAPSEPSRQKYEGIGRLGLFGAVIGIAVLGGILSAATNGSAITTFLTLGLMLIPASSRLKNIGRNPCWCFLLLVPFLGLLVSVPCFLLPAGYQRHRKLDLPAKIICAGILALLIGILIWAFTLK